MNVRKEINDFSSEVDKPILNWLFDRYHMASQWQFVAGCRHQRYGKLSYETNRIWYPTEEGKALYAQLSKGNLPSDPKQKKRLPISMKRFISRFQQTIDCTIRSQAPGTKINNEEREMWVMNDEPLYKLALEYNVQGL